MALEVQEKLKSPCIKLCKLDEKRERCIGCKRTIQEIKEFYERTKHSRTSNNKTNI